MKITIVENYGEMSKEAAKILAAAVKDNLKPVLGLATGGTPVGVYRELIEMYRNGEISFKNVTAANLDEYVGLDAESPQSYVSFMKSNLFGHIDIDPSKTFIPDGKAKDLQKECDRYTELLADIPRTVQLLGLGSDGHIGFNEPGTPFTRHTHIAELTQDTVKDNSRFFASMDEVPRKAITMGIADIVSAQTVLLLASGKNKARAVYDMIKGEVSEDCPASILQRHPNAVIIIDKEAAQLL